jgi:uncharacterized protein HemX
MTEETQVPETPETPKKPTNKKAIAIISCALALVLGGVGVGGYIALKSQQNKEAFEAKANLLLNHFIDMAIQGYGWIVA